MAPHYGNQPTGGAHGVARVGAPTGTQGEAWPDTLPTESQCSSTQMEEDARGAAPTVAPARANEVLTTPARVTPPN